jgi:hypothetical protein
MPHRTTRIPAEATIALPRTNFRCSIRPLAKGARAISPQPIVRPTIAAQSSRRDVPCEMFGMIVNASHETEVTKKPVQRKRSSRRP